jgi:hypothetical protein
MKSSCCRILGELNADRERSDTDACYHSTAWGRSFIADLKQVAASASEYEVSRPVSTENDSMRSSFIPHRAPQRSLRSERVILV